MLRETQKREFFLIMDRGSTVRAAAAAVGVSPDVGYRWMKKAGLSARRTTPRVYTDAEKAEFFRLLATHQLKASMGRIASAADNAAMESFSALLQTNVFDRHTWDRRDELHLATIDWVERTYSRRRRQRALGRLTPVEFEALLQSSPAQTAA